MIYEPQADGSLELVGIENLVFQAAWKAAGGRLISQATSGTRWLMIPPRQTRRTGLRTL